MTILFMEGFDGFATDANTNNVKAAAQARGITVTNGGNIVAGNGRLAAFPGKTWGKPDGVGSAIQPAGALVSGRTNLTVGFAAVFTAIDTNAPILTMHTSELVNFELLGLSNLGGIRLLYDPTGTGNDISIDIPVSLNVWHYYEVSWSPSAVSLYIDNVLAYTKAGTFPALATFPTSIPLQFLRVNGALFSTGSLDDIYISDSSTPLGECYCRYLAPGADTALTGTASVVGGASAAVVVPSFDGGTSYVNLPASADKFLTSLADITDNPAVIHAVQVTSQSAKTDTSSASYDVRLKTTTEQTIQTIAPATGYAGYRSIAGADPADSGPWTKAKVNSLEAGISKV